MRRWSNLLVPRRVYCCSAPRVRAVRPGGGMRPAASPAAATRRAWAPRRRKRVPPRRRPSSRARIRRCSRCRRGRSSAKSSSSSSSSTATSASAPTCSTPLNLGIWQGATRPARAPFTIPYTEFGSNGMPSTPTQPRVELRRARQIELPHRQPDLGRHAPAPRADRQRHRAGARQGAARHLRQHGHGLDPAGLLPQSDGAGGAAPTSESRWSALAHAGRAADGGSTRSTTRSAPSAPGPRCAPRSASCASAACRRTGASACSSTTATASTATTAPTPIA